MELQGGLDARLADISQTREWDRRLVDPEDLTSHRCRIEGFPGWGNVSRGARYTPEMGHQSGALTVTVSIASWTAFVSFLTADFGST